MPLALAEKWAAPLASAMARFGICTARQRAMFLAQVGHESGGFLAVVENLNYSAHSLARTWPARYAQKNGSPNARAKSLHRKPELIANDTYGGRMGNTLPGDGWLYRGRGLIQITGRENYQRAETELGLPLVLDPDTATGPFESALIAAWYWRTRNLNHLADAGRVAEVTRKINGGLNGLADRQERYALALGVLT